MVVQRIHEHAVVTRLQCLDSGEAGQAADRGVTVGSIILEVVGVSEPGDEGRCSKVFEAIAKARRPMRVVFLRLSQLLRPVRTAIPLIVWRGELDLALGGARMPALTGTAVAAIVRDARHGNHRVEMQWRCAPWLSVVVVGEEPEVEASIKSRRFSVGVRVRAAVPGMMSPPQPSEADRTDGRLTVIRPLLEASLTPDGAVVALCSRNRRSRLEVLRALTTRLFPDELALQAEGTGTPRVVQSGTLELLSRRLGIASAWTPYRFALRTDGSLQWYGAGAGGEAARGQALRSRSGSGADARARRSTSVDGQSTPVPAHLAAAVVSRAAGTPSPVGSGSGIGGRGRRPLGGIRVTQAVVSSNAALRQELVPRHLLADGRVFAVKMFEPARALVLRAQSEAEAREWTARIHDDVLTARSKPLYRKYKVRHGADTADGRDVVVEVPNLDLATTLVLREGPMGPEAAAAATADAFLFGAAGAQGRGRAGSSLSSAASSESLGVDGRRGRGRASSIAKRLSMAAAAARSLARRSIGGAEGKGRRAASAASGPGGREGEAEDGAGAGDDEDAGGGSEDEPGPEAEIMAGGGPGLRLGRLGPGQRMAVSALLAAGWRVPAALRRPLILPAGGVVPGWALAPAAGREPRRLWYGVPSTAAAPRAVEDRAREGALAEMLADVPAAARLYSPELLGTVRWSVLRQLRAMRERPSLLFDDPGRGFRLLVRAGRDMDDVAGTTGWRQGSALAPLRDAEPLVRGGAVLGVGLARPGSERATALRSAAALEAGLGQRGRGKEQVRSAGPAERAVTAAVAVAGCAGLALWTAVLVTVSLLVVAAAGGWYAACVLAGCGASSLADGARRAMLRPLARGTAALLGVVRAASQRWTDAVALDPDRLGERERELLARIDTGTDGAPRSSWDVFSDTDDEADALLVARGDGEELRTDGSAAALRRHHFVVLVSRFMPTVADAYGAGVVFDALTEDTEQVTVTMPASAVLVNDDERRRIKRTQEEAAPAAAGASGVGVDRASEARPDGTTPLAASAALGGASEGAGLAKRRWWRRSALVPDSSQVAPSGASEAWASPRATQGGDGGRPAAPERWRSWRTPAPLCMPLPGHDQGAAGPTAAVSRERVLGLEVFQTFVARIAGIVRTRRPKWEGLRDVLSLDTKELLIRSEAQASAVISVRAQAPVFAPDDPRPSAARRLVRPLTMYHRGAGGGAEHGEDAGEGGPGEGGRAAQGTPVSALRRRRFADTPGSTPGSLATGTPGSERAAGGRAGGRFLPAETRAAFERLLADGPGCAVVRPLGRGRLGLVGRAPAVLASQAPQHLAPMEGGVWSSPAVFGRTLWQWTTDGQRVRVRERRRRMRALALREGESVHDNTRGWGIFTDSGANSGIEERLGPEVDKEDAEAEARRGAGDFSDSESGGDAAPPRPARWSSGLGASGDAAGSGRQAAGRTAAVPAGQALVASASAALPAAQRAAMAPSSAQQGELADDDGEGSEEAETAQRSAEATQTRFREARRRLLDTGRTQVRLSGTLFLSDRALYLLSGSEVLVVPLAGIGGRVEYCKTPSSFLGLVQGSKDNGLHLPSCEVSHVELDSTVTAGMLDNDATKTRSDTGTALAAARDVAFPADPPVAVRVPRLAGAGVGGAGAGAGGLPGAVPASASSSRSLGAALGGGGADPEADTTMVRVRRVLDGSVSPEVTLVMSLWKDMMVSRGEERLGGRRRVVHEALLEMQTAAGITAALRDGPTMPLAEAAARSGMVASGPGAVTSALRDMDLARLRATLARKQAAAVATECRLSLLASLNLQRTRAVLKTTGRCVDGLLHCTNASEHVARDATGASLLQAEVVADVDEAVDRAWAAEQPTGLPPSRWVVAPALRARAAEEGCAVHWPSVPVAVRYVLTPQDLVAVSCEDGQLLPRFHVGAADAMRQAAAHALAHSRIEGGGNKEQHGTVAVASAVCEGAARWLTHAAALAARDAEASRRRHKEQHTFTMTRFRGAWGTMVASLFTPLVLFRNLVLYLWAWESPAVSLGVMSMLLSLCWLDLLQYAGPIGMLTFALGVAVWRGLDRSVRGRLLRSMYEPDTAAPGQRTSVFNWRSQLRNLSLGMGTGQFRIAKLNLALAKIRSLVAWRDPVRTRVFITALLCMSFFFALVPARVWFAVLVLVQFTRPLRDTTAGVALIAFNRFVDGIPVPSAAADIGTGSGAVPDPDDLASVSTPETGIVVRSLRPSRGSQDKA